MLSTKSCNTVFLVLFLLFSPMRSIEAKATDDHERSDFLHLVCSKLSLTEDQCCILGKSVSFAGYAATAAAVGSVDVPALLTSMGFGATGLISGSWAAWYQATYGIETTFSWLQSVSMTGSVAAGVTKVAVGLAAMKIYFI
jgi:hypothetical protein